VIGFPASDGELSVEELEQLYRRILESVGEDPNRQGLVRTPRRAAEALGFLTGGYAADVASVVNNAVFEAETDEMVLIEHIELYSLCEHHLLPFFGRCHVAYVPDGKIIGISKIPRIVEVFARRLQIQERLTVQIANALHESIAPQGVGVVIEARHLCMMMRGVEKQNSLMKTSCMLGSFRTSSATRAEFLSLIGSR
jgi:GTP cyclohydrolase I